MRIVYPGVFGAVLMRRPSSFIVPLLIMLIVSLLLLWMALDDLLCYLRLKRHGVKAQAKILSLERGMDRGGLFWRCTYQYTAYGIHQRSSFDVMFPLRRCRKGQTLDIRYDDDTPSSHIVVPEDFYACLAKLFLALLITAVFAAAVAITLWG